MQKFSFDIIGTHLDILLDSDVDASIFFQKIKNRLSEFEQKYSRFLENNWLSDLNMTRRWVLDIDGKKMLLYALEVAKKTDGYFDPTIGKRLTELGYGNPKTGIQSLSSEKWNYVDIEIQNDEVLLHKDIFLEFGWVGKGYLIDIIQGILMDFPRFLVNFWGDMYGKWIWKVGLESPFILDELIGTYFLEDTFLACSSGKKRKWGNHHHLIDPKTGESTHEVIATFIDGDSGISTDTYATALSVMPWEKAIETLKNTSEISGVLVRSDGIVFQKEGSSMELFQ